MRTWGWMTVAALLASCAGSSGGPTARHDYTLFSSDGNMPVGRGVIYLYGDWSGSEGEFDAPVGDPRINNHTHEFEGIVETAGEIAVSYSHARTDPYWVTIYLDADNSGTLSSGDLTWMDFGDNFELTIPCGAVAGGIGDGGEVTEDYVWEEIGESVCFGYGEYAGTKQSY